MAGGVPCRVMSVMIIILRIVLVVVLAAPLPVVLSIVISGGVLVSVEIDLALDKHREDTSRNRPEDHSVEPIKPN